MNIKKLELCFENCDSIIIDGQNIGNIQILDIEEKIFRSACNYISHIKTCKYFYVEFNHSANVIDYELGIPDKDNQYKIFDRIIKYKDIVSIIVTLIDKKTNNESQIDLYVDYQEKEEFKNIIGSSNINQSVYISKLGDLYLLITKDKDIFNVIDKDKVDNKTYMNLYWNLFNINKKVK